MSTQYALKQILDSDIILSETSIPSSHHHHHHDSDKKLVILNHGTHLTLRSGENRRKTLRLAGISSSVVGVVDLLSSSNSSSLIIRFMIIEANGTASVYEIIDDVDEDDRNENEIILIPISRHEPQNSSTHHYYHQQSRNTKDSLRDELMTPSKIFNALLLSENQYKNDIFPAMISSVKRIPSNSNNNSFVCVAVILPSNNHNQEIDSSTTTSMIIVYLFSVSSNTITSSCFVTCSSSSKKFTMMNLFVDEGKNQDDKEEFFSNPDENETSSSLSENSILRMTCTEVFLDVAYAASPTKTIRHVLEVRSPMTSSPSSASSSSKIVWKSSSSSSIDLKSDKNSNSSSSSSLSFIPTRPTFENPSPAKSTVKTTTTTTTTAKTEVENDETHFFGRPTASTFSPATGEIFMANKYSVLRRVAMTTTDEDEDDKRKSLWGEIPIDSSSDDTNWKNNNNMWCFPSSKDDDDCLFIFVESPGDEMMMLYKTSDDEETKFLKQISFCSSNPNATNCFKPRKILQVSENESYFFWIDSDGVISVLRKKDFSLLQVTSPQQQEPVVSLKSATASSSSSSSNIEFIASDTLSKKLIAFRADIDETSSGIEILHQHRNTFHESSTSVFEQLLKINHHPGDESTIVCGIVDDTYEQEQQPAHQQQNAFFCVLGETNKNNYREYRKVFLPFSSTVRGNNCGKPCQLVQLEQENKTSSLLLVKTTNLELFIFDVVHRMTEVEFIPLLDFSSRITNVASVVALNSSSSSSILICGQENVATQNFIVKISKQQGDKKRKYLIEKHRIRFNDEEENSPCLLFSTHSWLISKSTKSMKLFKNFHADDVKNNNNNQQQKRQLPSTTIFHDHHLLETKNSSSTSMIITTMICTQSLLFLGVVNYPSMGQNGILVLDLFSPSLNNVKGFFPISSSSSFCTSSILVNSVIGERGDDDDDGGRRTSFAVFGTSSGDIIVISSSSSSSSLKIVSQFKIPSTIEESGNNVSRKKSKKNNTSDHEHLSQNIFGVITLCASKIDPSLCFASLTNNSVVAIRLFSKTILMTMMMTKTSTAETNNSNSNSNHKSSSIIAGSISHKIHQQIKDIVSLDSTPTNEIDEEAILCGSLSSGVSCLIFRKQGILAVSCADPTPNHVLFACFDGRNCRHGALDSFNFLVLDAFRNLSWGRTPENKKKKKKKKHHHQTSTTQDDLHQDGMTGDKNHRHVLMNGNDDDDDDDYDVGDEVFTSPYKSSSPQQQGANSYNDNNNNNNNGSSSASAASPHQIQNQNNNQTTSSSASPTTRLANEPQPTHLETPSTIWGGGCKLQLSSSNFINAATFINDDDDDGNDSSLFFLNGSCEMEITVSSSRPEKCKRTIWKPQQQQQQQQQNTSDVDSSSFVLNEYAETEGRSNALLNARENEFYQQQFAMTNKNSKNTRAGVKFIISSTGSITCLYRMPRAIFEVASVVQSKLIQSMEFLNHHSNGRKNNKNFGGASSSSSSPSSSSTSTFSNPTFVSPFRRTLNISFVFCSILKWFGGNNATTATTMEKIIIMEALRSEFPTLLHQQNSSSSSGDRIWKLIDQLMFVGGMI